MKHAGYVLSRCSLDVVPDGSSATLATQFAMSHRLQQHPRYGVLEQSFGKVWLIPSNVVHHGKSTSDVDAWMLDDCTKDTCQLRAVKDLA